jgi:predicted transposase/invertase (TIGR01784 family)
MERLNPLNDYAFKQIMEKESLIAFLNAVFNPDDQKKLVSDEDALALYRAREDSVHERANLIYTGRMEGIIEGKLEGRAEGIEEGIEKGKIQIAQTMLAKNTPLDFIAEVTGLSMEEIKALQAK